MSYLLPFIFSFILTLIITYLLINFQKKRKIGQMVREEGPVMHYKKKGTPTLGGISFLIVLILTYIFMPKTPFTNNLILFVLLESSIGLFDDLIKLIKKNAYGLKARWKIVLQIIFSIPLIIFLIKNYGTYFYLPFSGKDIYVSTPIFVIITLFLSVGAVNSFNFTDGLDGLLSGLSLILIPLFTIFLSKNVNIIPLIAIGGSLLAFLWFNFNPAEIFMGDTGSSFLGAFFIFYSLSFKLEIIIPIFMLIFGIETLSVIIQVLYFKYTKRKYKEGKRVFRMSPIHHHFELLGIPEQKITIRFWICQVILILITFSILYIP